MGGLASPAADPQGGGLPPSAPPGQDGGGLIPGPLASPAIPGNAQIGLARSGFADFTDFSLRDQAGGVAASPGAPDHEFSQVVTIDEPEKQRVALVVLLGLVLAV